MADHPYHAVTDTNGAFQLTDVPAGTWTARVWHELLGSVDQDVGIAAGESRTLNVALQAVATDKESAA